MTTMMIVIAGLLVLVLVALAVMGQRSRSGSAPGLDGGRLTRCADRPNCVGSEYPDDEAHLVAPLSYSDGQREAARAALAGIIADMGGDLVVDESSYLTATFRSRVFGFVDDLEIRFDTEMPIIHLRSASRVGYSDRGVNRKRVKRLRTTFAAQ